MYKCHNISKVSVLALFVMNVEITSFGDYKGFFSAIKIPAVNSVE